jgi:hypothetical protein
MSPHVSQTSRYDFDGVGRLYRRPRRMDGPARLHAAVELSESVREIRRGGLRARHPELSPRQAIARWVLEEYGLKLPASE